MLSLLEMTARQQQHLRPFRAPAPMREVSLVVHRHFVKRKLIEVLKEEVLKVLPEKVKKNRGKSVVPVVG